MNKTYCVPLDLGRLSGIVPTPYSNSQMLKSLI